MPQDPRGLETGSGAPIPPPAPETRQQYWTRRGRELNKQNKAALCALYRKMGGLGGVHPPEKWRKDEVVSEIVDMEYRQLPEDRKAPTPPLMCPPCDTCGGGQDASAHEHGGDHHYNYTHNPNVEWVQADTEGQPPAARPVPPHPEHLT